MKSGQCYSRCTICGDEAPAYVVVQTLFLPVNLQLYPHFSKQTLHCNRKIEFRFSANLLLFMKSLTVQEILRMESLLLEVWELDKILPVVWSSMDAEHTRENIYVGNVWESHSCSVCRDVSADLLSPFPPVKVTGNE